MPGIKMIKPKVEADAVSTKKPTNLKDVADGYAGKISKMNDKQLLEDSAKQSIKGNDARKEQAIDSLATRNIKRRGGYKMGTSGIKVKGKSC
jgi:hypothetical protein